MTNPLLKKLRVGFNALLERSKDSNFPNVDVITATMRPEMKEQYVAQLNAQTVNLGRVIITAEGYTNEDKDFVMENLTNGVAVFVDFDPSNKALGHRYNLAMTQAVSDYVAIVTDDDVYHPNYLRGQLAVMYKEKTIIVGKANPVCVLTTMGTRGFLPNNYLGGYNRRTALGAIVFRRDVHYRAGAFAKTDDFIPSFLSNARKLNINMSDGLPFNFEVSRKDKDNQTWLGNNVDLADVAANSITSNDVIV